MKKRTIIALLLVVVLSLSAVALVACGPKEKEAYGVAYTNSRGASYVARASYVEGKDGIESATLDEACFPYQVKADAADGEFTVEYNGAHYYKTVKWGKVTATFKPATHALDASKGEVVNYEVNGKTLEQFFADEKEAKAYFDAVAASKITVVTSAGDKTDLMTAETMLKSKNGYWSVDAPALGWKGNRDKTIAYVIAHGVNNTLTAGEDKVFADAEGNKTGATWTAMPAYYALFTRAK